MLDLGIPPGFQGYLRHPEPSAPQIPDFLLTKQSWHNTLSSSSFCPKEAIPGRGLGSFPFPFLLFQVKFNLQAPAGMGFGGGDFQRFVRDTIQERSQKGGKATTKIPMNGFTKLGMSTGISRKTSRCSCSFPATRNSHFAIRLGRAKCPPGALNLQGAGEPSLEFPSSRLIPESWEVKLYSLG